ncbi:MAG: NADPH:quinone oxidoreductase family protein [Rhodocyclaceae bacterium]|jgi:NADPH2:quinone reductase|nr:NADPH:quinone oxidoreductase family protein [Rhodocyclaceae bacterium]MBK6907190.1 NADPH:quinone oxidoreductase family protein [Rhodocyclaceae bacterium]
MKALVCTTLGLPDSLVFTDIPEPSPGPGQVIIDMKAAGVNFADTLIIQGKYQIKPPLPFAPGSELAGVVSALGEGAEGIGIGQPVFCFCEHGAFAEKVRVDARQLIPIPIGLDFDVAASLTLAYGTSYHALKDRAALIAGETLLVLGAAGGVGLSAIQIGKALGARVIAAASSPEKLALCQENGADALINYATESLRDRLKSLTDGKGPDVIYDPVGGQYAEPAFRSIAWRGRYLVIGFANGEIPALPLNLPLLKGASVIGVFFGDYVKRELPNFTTDLAEMLDLTNSGQLNPHISARYRLEDGARALQDLLERKVTGKVILVNE